MRVSGSILDSIGNTPLIELKSFQRWLGKKKVRIFAKCEFSNPGGSVKDRPAKRMILEGIRAGKLTREKTILDSSSGNTGIAYAMIGAALGYKALLVMPENASEKKRIIQTFGAQVVYTDPMEGSDGAIAEAHRLYEESPRKYFMPDQYNNPENWKAHYETTGPEIWEQTQKSVTHFVAGIGTGGTLMGAGKRLREFNKNIKLVEVEPSDALHGLEGMKHMDSSIVPGIYDKKFADRKVSVYTEDAYEMCCRLAREEGILAGYSSGAALQGALEVGLSVEDGFIVTVLPDAGDRYLRMRFWDEVLSFWEKNPVVDHGPQPS